MSVVHLRCSQQAADIIGATALPIGALDDRQLYRLVHTGTFIIVHAGHAPRPFIWRIDPDAMRQA